MLRKLTIILLLSAAWHSAFAFTEARLISKSTSGMTVQFNLGSHDNIGAGDFGVIGKQIADINSKKLKVIYVARARVVKVNSDSSIWIVYNVSDPAHLQKWSKYILLTESNMLIGRREPRVGETVVVTEEFKEKAQASHALKDDKDRLAKLKGNYDTIAITHEADPQADADLENINLERWDKVNEKMPWLRRSALYKGPSSKEFKRQVKLETFEKLVTAYFKRVNDPDFNYDAFYEASRRTDFSNEMKVKSDIDSEYNKFLRDESKRATADAKLFRTILQKGESWSEDYSDEELRRVLNEVSVLHEKDRRDWIGANPNRYMAAFDYGFIMSDAQTDSDKGYKRDSNRSYEVDFEVVPLLGHRQLERFSLNASARMSRNAFEANGFNADINETSLTVGANWYPLYAPYAIEAPVLTLGTYIRSGMANVQAPTVAEKANYTVISIPGLRVGMKYLLRNNWGLRFLLSMETLKLERYEASKLNSTLPENANLVETKFGLGVTYGF